MSYVSPDTPTKPKCFFSRRLGAPFVQSSVFIIRFLRDFTVSGLNLALFLSK